MHQGVPRCTLFRNASNSSPLSATFTPATHWRGGSTGGGAHTVSFLTLNKNFILKIPQGRAVNPISGTNWEGTGITPDVEVPADQAKEKAYQLAVQAIKGGGQTTD